MTTASKAYDAVLISFISSTSHQTNLHAQTITLPTILLLSSIPYLIHSTNIHPFIQPCPRPYIQRITKAYSMPVFKYPSNLVHHSSPQPRPWSRLCLQYHSLLSQSEHGSQYGFSQRTNMVALFCFKNPSMAFHCLVDKSKLLNIPYRRPFVSAILSFFQFLNDCTKSYFQAFGLLEHSSLPLSTSPY